MPELLETGESHWESPDPYLAHSSLLSQRRWQNIIAQSWKQVPHKMDGDVFSHSMGSRVQTTSPNLLDGESRFVISLYYRVRQKLPTSQAAVCPRA